jgi:hypothetical protein
MSQKWPCPCNGHTWHITQHNWHTWHITQHNGQGLDHSIVVVLQSPRWISSTWQQTSFGRSPSREHMLASGNRDDQRTSMCNCSYPTTHTHEKALVRQNMIALITPNTHTHTHTHNGLLVRTLHVGLSSSHWFSSSLGLVGLVLNLYIR